MALRKKDSKSSPIGARLKQRRKELGLTLGELAKKSGLSSPFLSQAERNQTVPSMVSLMKLAEALDVELKYFMEIPHDESIIHRRKSLSEIDVDSPVVYCNMSSKLANQQMNAVLMKIPPGHEFPTDRRDGEDFLYVVKGELYAEVGDIKATLKAGDAMHFDSRAPHNARNETNEEVELLYIGTPIFF